MASKCIFSRYNLPFNSSKAVMKRWLGHVESFPVQSNVLSSIIRFPVRRQHWVLLPQTFIVTWREKKSNCKTADLLKHIRVVNVGQLYTDRTLWPHHCWSHAYIIHTVWCHWVQDRINVTFKWSSFLYRLYSSSQTLSCLEKTINRII